MDRHRQTPWHARKLTEVYETLHTSEEGLGDAEAAERRKKYGRNELRSKPPKTILQMLKAQACPIPYPRNLFRNFQSEDKS